ncbi:hypothetical protein [Geobacter sp.]|uniref:hypothetical protein n=1 Tax=Geobacter sp. TaxID=46610 RepID=UPI0027BAE220|nr:hypothetical protein [Geobacter sp.]
MQVDIVGRVNNLDLPITKPFIPLLECLVNSIDSIEDGGIKDGRIDIYIERDFREQTLPNTDETFHAPIKDITVTDNGIGFNDNNARTFFLSDSTKKAIRGNKGIGRFTWLKVFEKARIKSTYPEGEAWFTRSFDFVKTTDGIENEEVNDATRKLRTTTVKLLDLQPEYQKAFPKHLETIAHKIIDHLLIHFVNGTCPQILLSDNANSSLNVNQLFAEEAKSRGQEVDCQIRELNFKITFLRYQSGATKHHTISYSANKREVIEWKAGTSVSDFKVKFIDDSGQSFVFKTYVSGSYLDSKVNSERTSIQFLQDGELDYPHEITRAELDAAVITALKKVAEPFMTVLKKEKRQSIEQFVINKAPQFRFILNDRYQKHLEKISPNLSDDQLDIEIYKAQRDIEIEHRQEASKINSPPPLTLDGAEEYKALYEQYLEQENELGKAALAKYVIHRRTILEMLDNALKIQDNGKFVCEDIVHNLIYPMRTTSADIEFSKQNLWVVDERLAYHWYLASDKTLSSIKVADVKGGDEPDIVTFNTPRAFTESKSPYQSVVIVEFKRPERNEYPDKDEDPIDQILRYVDKIKEGTAKDKDGKTFTVGTIPFYAYLLCSLTPKIRKIARSRDFTSMPDNEGYFAYHKEAGCYIEIISFDKVLSDAKKRNRAFFEHLQIPCT